MELYEQKQDAAESGQRRLRLLEEEGYVAHEHGKSLTQDALYNLNNNSEYAYECYNQLIYILQTFALPFASKVLTRISNMVNWTSPIQYLNP